jgi:hypothetical protein
VAVALLRRRTLTRMNIGPRTIEPDSHGISRSGPRAALSLSSVPRAASVLARMGAFLPHGSTARKATCLNHLRHPANQASSSIVWPSLTHLNSGTNVRCVKRTARVFLALAVYLQKLFKYSTSPCI